MFRFAVRDAGSRRLATGVLATAMFALGSAAFAQRLVAAEDGFAAMAGSWSGGGTINASNGSSERIRCRVNYQVTPSGGGLHQDLRCASDSYNFQVSSDILNQGGSISGTWSELTRHASGSVSGRINGSSIQTNVSGPGFTASLGINTRGNSQAVSIRPQGTDISSISVNLSRN